MTSIQPSVDVSGTPAGKTPPPVPPPGKTLPPLESVPADVLLEPELEAEPPTATGPPGFVVSLPAPLSQPTAVASTETPRIKRSAEFMLCSISRDLAAFKSRNANISTGTGPRLKLVPVPHTYATSFFRRAAVLASTDSARQRMAGIAENPLKLDATHVRS